VVATATVFVSSDVPVSFLQLKRLCWWNLSTGTETIMYSVFLRKPTKIHFTYTGLYEAWYNTLQYTTNTDFKTYHIEHTHIPVLKSNHGKGIVQNPFCAPNSNVTHRLQCNTRRTKHVIHVTSTLFVTFLSNHGLQYEVNQSDKLCCHLLKWCLCVSDCSLLKCAL